MKPITLYRIAKGQVPYTYRVTHVYSMYTQRPLNIPESFDMDTVYINSDYADWFADCIFPVIEAHNGDNIIFKWMDEGASDPSYLTIALSVDGTNVIVPDMLANLTTIHDSDYVHRQIRKGITKAIANYGKTI